MSEETVHELGTTPYNSKTATIVERMKDLRLKFADGDLYAGQQLGEILQEYQNADGEFGDELREKSYVLHRNKCIFLQTPTYFWLGRVIHHDVHGVLLDNAAWVRDTGEDPGAMFREGNWASGYPVPGIQAVSRLAIMNVIPWRHENLPHDKEFSCDLTLGTGKTGRELIEDINDLTIKFDAGDLVAGQILGEIVAQYRREEGLVGDYLRERSHVLKEDKRIFVQTPTYFWLGQVIHHGVHGMILDDAAWVRDTGEDPGAMFRDGNWASGYAVPGVHAISRLAVMNIIPWTHKNLPHHKS